MRVAQRECERVMERESVCEREREGDCEEATLLFFLKFNQIGGW